MKTRLPGHLERADLDDDGQRFEHEDAADERQQELLLDQDGDRAQRAAERERADVAHENFRRGTS